MEPSSTLTFPTEAIPCRNLPVLLLDDNHSFRRGVAELLRDNGHEVRDYTHPLEVPPIPTLGEISLVVSDYQMPGQDGLAFADAFHRVHPTVPIILVTASIVPRLRTEAAVRSFLHLAPKPVEDHL